MYCKNCGKEIPDEAVICVHCGVMVKDIDLQHCQLPKKYNVFGIVGFIAAILTYLLGWAVMAAPFVLVLPVIGLVLCIIGIVRAKAYNSSNGLAVAGLILSIVSVLMWFCVFVFIANMIVVI